MRVTMKPGSTMRVARPTDNLAAIAEMYAKGLGFTVLAEFKDHRGFDGVILGHPRQPYHIEFTSQREHQVGKAPTQDHLLILPSYNPYWDPQGRTFEDIDGYRVVLQNAAWNK